MQGEGKGTAFFPCGPWIIRWLSGEKDAEEVVRLHESVYGPEYGFDASFAEYVRGPLNAFLSGKSQRSRLWLAERENGLAGCIALVEISDQEAQLRWFVVGREHRGRGLGSRLMAECLDFARRNGYRTVSLWTVDLLQAAARVYAQAGFTLTESKPRTLWGLELVEQKLTLAFR